MLCIEPMPAALSVLLLLLAQCAVCVKGESFTDLASDHGALTSVNLTSLPSEENVPPVFRNGAWDPNRVGGGGGRNAYIAAVLSKDIYVKHVIDPRDGAAARRNFSRFATQFCRSMERLGADECEAVSGPQSLVWAVVRAGRTVLLVVRGSNTPQNWLADVASFRTVNVGDLGGGSPGVNVAAGFYKVFAVNRRPMVERVRAAMKTAAAAAAAAAAATASASAPATTTASNPASAATAAAAVSIAATTTPLRVPAGGDSGNSSSSKGTGGGGDNNMSSNSSSGADEDNRGPRLWVLGHSLGGAVALLAAAHLDAMHGLAAAGVFTFGCPRTGDDSWARAYRLHDVTLRLDNTGDIIPGLPFGSSWRHVGSAATLQACRASGEAGFRPSGPPPQQLPPLVRKEPRAAALAGGGDQAKSDAFGGSGSKVLRELEHEELGDSVASGVAVGMRQREQGEHLLRGRQQEVREMRSRRRLLVGSAVPASMAVDAARKQSSKGGDVGAYTEGPQQQPQQSVQIREPQQQQRMQGQGHQVQPTQQPQQLQDQGAMNVSFPVPLWLRNHMIQTYVHVMWSCLPDQDSELVPGPDDMYDRALYGKLMY